MQLRLLLPLAVFTSFISFCGQAHTWQFKVEPYLMATNIDGDSKIGTTSAPLAVDFDTILNNLDSAFMMRFEAFHQSNWGVIVDWAYMDLNKSHSVAKNGVLDARVRQGVLELALARKFYSPSAGEWINYVGVRRWDNTYQFTLDPTLIPELSLVDRDEDWLDLILGFKADKQLSEDWLLTSTGDIGGFGLSSRLTGSLKLGITFQLSRHWQTALLYKGTYVDYQSNDDLAKDDFEYKTITHGPIVNISYDF